MNAVVVTRVHCILYSEPAQVRDFGVTSYDFRFCFTARQAPSEKGSSLKGKNLVLPRETNYFLECPLVNRNMITAYR